MTKPTSPVLDDPILRAIIEEANRKQRDDPTIKESPYHQVEIRCFDAMEPLLRWVEDEVVNRGTHPGHCVEAMLWNFGCWVGQQISANAATTTPERVAKAMIDSRESFAHALDTGYTNGLAVLAAAEPQGNA